MQSVEGKVGDFGNNCKKRPLKDLGSGKIERKHNTLFVVEHTVNLCGDEHSLSF
jgi:hypothetical protein